MKQETEIAKWKCLKRSNKQHDETRKNEQLEGESKTESSKKLDASNFAFIDISSWKFYKLRIATILGTTETS